MKRGTLIVLAVMLAACGSSRSRDDEPTTVPPPASEKASPSIEARLTDLQTSMTELLDQLDVLNARIGKLESGAPAPSPASSSPAPAGAPAPHQEPLIEAYRRGLMLFAQNKHAEARAAFQQVLSADPAGQLADNALFWIGETYFTAGDYNNAMRYYERVAKEFSDQNKAPDALYKMGIAFVKTGDLGMAQRTFEECIRKYPYSSPAASAKVELKRIKY